MQTISSSHRAPNPFSQKTRSLLRKPMMPVVRLPACLNARSCGKTGATPRPPPTRTTWPTSRRAAQAERADEVGERVALLVAVAHLQRRLAERLDDQRHRAAPRGRSRPRSAGSARCPRAAAASRSGRARPTSRHRAPSTSHRKVVSEKASRRAIVYMEGLGGRGGCASLLRVDAPTEVRRAVDPGQPLRHARHHSALRHGVSPARTSRRAVPRLDNRQSGLAMRDDTAGSFNPRRASRESPMNAQANLAVAMGGVPRVRKSRWPAKLDFAQSATGLSSVSSCGATCSSCRPS